MQSGPVSDAPCQAALRLLPPADAETARRLRAEGLPEVVLDDDGLALLTLLRAGLPPHAAGTPPWPTPGPGTALALRDVEGVLRAVVGAEGLLPVDEHPPVRSDPAAGAAPRDQDAPPAAPPPTPERLGALLAGARVLVLRGPPLPGVVATAERTAHDQPVVVLLALDALGPEIAAATERGVRAVAPADVVVVRLPVPRDTASSTSLLRALLEAVGVAAVLEPPDAPDELLRLLRAGREVRGLDPRLADALALVAPPPDRAGVVVLLTGLSGSGKSTVAAALVARLREHGGRRVTVLDGDDVRSHLSRGLGFSRADRDANVERIGWVAAVAATHGGAAVCAPIAPYDAPRRAVRRRVQDVGGSHVLVHVATPLAVCEARDRKGLYARARRGEIPEFTGVSDPYEVPGDADVVVDTSRLSAAAAADRVMDHLGGRGLLGAGWTR